jgi:hypothetical protein
MPLGGSAAELWEGSIYRTPLNDEDVRQKFDALNPFAGGA